MKYPSHCCQVCGQNIGWFGRIFDWFIGGDLHGCYKNYDIESLSKKYDELIFAVGRKFPHETRHQTALRYIREAESTTTKGNTKCVEER